MEGKKEGNIWSLRGLIPHWEEGDEEEEEEEEEEKNESKYLCIDATTGCCETDGLGKYTDFLCSSSNDAAERRFGANTFGLSNLARHQLVLFPTVLV